ncbi:hypothetical protein BT63DRAFT_449632 [Microthyrium microscopicum]|uniref:Phosphatidate cytidylyltransferase n=1 Tax=Microthyrium microscopicum TaxID=703497 RepID=A0A6A6UQV0_9PEZI|nr:hypothetical protein BT63DRAFT_449632 [Microthyrium microscopicum]
MPDTLSPPNGLRAGTFDSEDLTTSGSDTPRKPLRRSQRKTAGKRTSSSTANGPSSDINGHLQVPRTSARREPSRSPSPLGLIPIHSTFRSFVHRHEIPRKALHVSIGFLTLTLYAKGFQTDQIHPVLLTALIPVATADILRHNFPAVNKLYIRLCGALMRESEVDGYNGVIWYLAGTWAVLRFCPKDIGVMGVLLLSWCDTAASTVGRAWGKYSYSLRKGKSLAGSTAALLVGVATAWGFWGWAAPRVEVGSFGVLPSPFAFRGTLGLPSAVKELLGWSDDSGTISGTLAMGTLSLVTGVIASVSEAIDVYGWDDNFTIPVFSAIGLWGFLKVFGSA